MHPASAAAAEERRPLHLCHYAVYISHSLAAIIAPSNATADNLLSRQLFKGSDN